MPISASLLRSALLSQENNFWTRKVHNVKHY